MARSREFNEKFQTLRESYLEKLPKQLDSIDNSWSMLNNINWDAQHLQKLQRTVHSIAGTAGSFGLERLSVEAKHLDGILRNFIDNNRLPDTATKIKAYTHIQEMLDSAGVISNLPTVDNLNATQSKKVLIVDDDENQASFLELLCFEMGCSTKVLNSPKLVAEYIKTDVPDVILMDIVFPEGQLAGIDAIKNIYQEIGFKVPVVFVSSRNDLSSRVKAFRAGGLGYLQKPVDFSELQVQFELLNNHQTYHAKILILDDDESLLELAKSMLESQGFYCIGSTQPSEVIHLLERHRPDVLLLDINMPKIKGDEILLVLRQELKYANLPILMVTSDTSMETIGFATSHGANGVIPKPLEFNVLLDSIHSVIRRSKSMTAKVEQIVKRDEANQSVQRHYFFTRIEQAIRLRAQGPRQVLASISFKNHENIRRQVGISHIDEVSDLVIDIIQEELESNEVVTKISELHFALILSNISQASFDRRLEKIVDRLNALEYKRFGHTIHMQACLSAINLTSKLSSVDEALQVVEAQMLELITSKNDQIAIQRGGAAEPLSDEELRKTILNALQKNALTLNYQPIIDVMGNERIFEGLARMRDDTGAIILPDDFIDIIKSTGKQQEFNRLLVSHCVDDIKNLRGQEAQETEIIIKLLLNKNSILSFLTWVSNNLRSSNLRGKNRLIFSVTKNDIFEYQAQIAELQRGLEDLDCSLMIEQVGQDTNDNVLDFVEQLNIKYIKLHPNMTRDIIKRNEQAIALLEELKSKDIPVIATHVEDNAMFSKLWENGIRYFQGYFVRRPEESLLFDFNIESTELK